MGRDDDLCLPCLIAWAGNSKGIPGITILDEIARGGMGVVSYAEQALPKRLVAIKTLHTHLVTDGLLVSRFRQETQVMADLEHPCILPVYEMGNFEGIPWYTMKLARNGSLASRIADFANKWKTISLFIARISDALDHMHRHGVLHRDVKPGNILFDHDDLAYLSDFGLANQFSAQSEQPSVTLGPSLLGTPAYLAPELASGNVQDATPRSDIYSLSAVLYELLVGRMPYPSLPLPLLLPWIAQKALTPLADIDSKIPRDLQRICEKGMARNPQLRYASASAMADDLRRFHHDSVFVNLR